MAPIKQCVLLFSIKPFTRKSFQWKAPSSLQKYMPLTFALSIISRDKHNKLIIFSDSLSVLPSLRNKKLENPLIVKLLNRLESMICHKEIIMYWIPSLIRVSRNERADLAAKSALDLSLDNISIPYTDLKPQINKFFLTKWQQRWNNNINNKLSQIKATSESQERIKCHYISIADWLHKSHSFFYTQAGTATTMFGRPDTLRH